MMIEYKIIQLKNSLDKIEEKLNLLSSEGWRVVGSCGKHDRHIILKRKIMERGE